MCGIVGYTGKKEATPILLDGLEKLEYRGYDSAGVAVLNKSNKVEISKAKGRLSILKDKLEKSPINGTTGIGHTRWATHGEPSENNAHPHTTDDFNITAVHNGIIENYQELREKLEKHDYKFYSETDTEVVVNLIDYYYKKYNIGPIDAIAKTMVRVRGTYALAIMFKDNPGQIWVARKDSPMIIGTSEDGTFVASDVPAILKHTNQVYYINNLEMACLEKDSVKFYNLNGDEVTHDLVEIKWDASQAEKEGYEHFMIKEIHEQPEVVEKTFRSLVIDGKIDLKKIGLTKTEIKKIDEIYILACGSAYHVGVTASYIIEKLDRIPVRVECASEFRYRNPVLKKNSLAIIVSQSGETADSLAALRLAKEAGVKTLGIVNVVGSTIAREADHVLYTLAGPEIAVATTKAYSAQLIAMYVLSLAIAQEKNLINEEELKNYLTEIEKIPESIKTVLESKAKIQKIASKFSNKSDIFFIGRGIDYAISLEGSLKLKEISYIHSEAYAAGELKHGTISLIEDGTLVIGTATQPNIYEKTVSNLVEVKSRGAKILSVSNNPDIEKVSDYAFVTPNIEPLFLNSVAIIYYQLLSYYISVSRGLDVDKPRNLAKSVTVE